MKITPWLPEKKIYRKGSRIYCMNGHHCAELSCDVPYDADLHQIADSIQCVSPNHKDENGLPNPRCWLCGEDIVYSYPRTLQ